MLRLTQIFMKICQRLYERLTIYGLPCNISSRDSTDGFENNLGKHLSRMGTIGKRYRKIIKYTFVMHTKVAASNVRINVHDVH